jgi:EAL domain-containing protein (putative c-di-GMP-specific phosphodiesterase class I)
MIEKKIEMIQEMGIKISIDDFGTGFSSFEKLVNLKFDRIKIDQSFIRHLPHSEKDLLVINAMASLAKGMSLKVTVEGVENYQQQECLKHFYFDAYQGYYYAKPLLLEEAMEIFDKDINRKFW